MRKIIVGDKILGGIPKEPTPAPPEPVTMTCICPICSTDFPGINSLTRHLQRLHGTDDSIVSI